MRNFIIRKLSKILLMLWCVSPISYANITCNDACLALDLNNDNMLEAQIDGILFVRHMFGLTQDLLIKDLDIGNDAFNEISKTIHSMGDALDIDNNGAVDVVSYVVTNPYPSKRYAESTLYLLTAKKLLDASDYEN